MSNEMDRAGPVRPDEQLNVAALEKYLRQGMPQLAGPLVVEQFPHGHSNLTYLVRVGDSELVLRRPPFGNQVQTAHDMHREFRVLSKLSAVFPAAPQPYLFCDDQEVLGAPFYIMERRGGLVLRKSLPSGIHATAELSRRLGMSLIDKLVELHAVDFQAAGLGDLGKPQGYVLRQVAGWAKRYDNARTESIEALEQAARWLHDQAPAEAPAALIHNDFKYDNLVLDPTDPARIVAVLDWEMATLGDPRMDLGTTLGYWVQADDPELLQRAAMGPTAAPGSLTRREIVDRYEQSSGREFAQGLFFYVYGLFKIAVIIQQIYARAVRGHTRDPRFTRLNELVAILSQQAERAINSGRL